MLLTNLKVPPPPFATDWLLVLCALKTAGDSLAFDRRYFVLLFVRPFLCLFLYSLVPSFVSFRSFLRSFLCSFIRSLRCLPEHGSAQVACQRALHQHRIKFGKKRLRRKIQDHRDRRKLHRSPLGLGPSGL